MSKRIFEDKSDKETEVIISVLEKYCVPYKVEDKEQFVIFAKIKTHDIIIDVNDEPWEYIKAKVNAALKLEEDRMCLEKSFKKDTPERQFFSMIPLMLTSLGLIEPFDVAFEDLPDIIKEKLLKQFSLDTLKNKCIFTMGLNGITMRMKK